jgi:hypothetical protein
MDDVKLKAVRRSASSSVTGVSDNATEVAQETESQGGAPQGDCLNPVVILALDAITHQTRALATIDGSRIPWLEANLELVKRVPSIPGPVASTGGRGQKPVFSARPGPKGRKVMVLRIDTDVYVGTWTHGTELENCAIASRELGCNYNAVLKSFNPGEDGLEVSTVHGVTFCYVDDYTAFINADIRGD